MRKLFPNAILALFVMALAAVWAVAPARADADTIDPAHDVSLTVKKFEGEAGDTTKPLDGVTFKIERIDVDLTTQAGWNTLANTPVAELPVAGLSSNVTTAAGGTATISTSTNAQFTVGAYRVTEQQYKDYTVAPPFVVTLPWSDADNGGAWVYEQTVQPKNQSVTPDKQVDSTNATIGTNLDYTINAPVPAGTLTQFVVRDRLNQHLELQQPATVTVSGAAAPELTGDDHTISYTDNTLVVTFTEAGRAKLQQARMSDPTLKVSVAFQAKVVSIPTDGAVTNTAEIDIPGGTVDTDVEDDQGGSTPTTTTFAPLTITKTGPGDVTNDQLNGAVFQVYECTKGSDGTWAFVDANPDEDGVQEQPVTIANADGTTTATEFTTSGGTADGATASTAKALGLPVSDTAGGEAGTVTKSYCALETKAPSGFLRNPEPQPITYQAGADGAAGQFVVSVENQKDSLLGQLPATGAWGLIAVLAVGVALIVRGVVTSRRDARDSAA